MNFIIKTFWISFACLLVISLSILGFVGIPAKSTTILKTIPNDRLPQ